MAVVVTLPVDTPPQPRLSENLLIERAALTQFHLLLELVDLSREFRRHLIVQTFSPT